MHKKNYLTIGLMLLLVGSALPGFAPAAADEHCDAVVAPGDDIQTALGAANSGDTVCLEEGTHALSSMVQIMKPVTLIGPNHENDPTDGGDRVGEAVVTPADPLNPLSRSVRVRTDDPGVTIAGITFQTQGTAIWVNGAEHVNNLTIDNNVFTGNVEAFGSSRAAEGFPNRLDDVTFSNNLIENNTGRTFSHYTGILGTGFDLTGNEIRDSPGIYLGFVDGANVTDNTVSTSFSAVFLADDIANVSIAGNSVSGNGTGVHVWQKTNLLGPVDVTDNAFIGLENGLNLTQGENLTTDATAFSVSGNDFSDNAVGVLNGGSGTLVATNNYWGAPTGPLVLGSPVEGDVEYILWCLLEDCTL